ncbi:unnamed protein product [Paramecium octaurelia]|uniref:Uncharacterized protein n=1 Tax=Paramecium octaurelia TaxID=43137 RepID=A0A8S1VME0_PAROT|nr:unnamed protein product [Paramecium octaurelia]
MAAFECPQNQLPMSKYMKSQITMNKRRSFQHLTALKISATLCFRIISTLLRMTLTLKLTKKIMCNYYFSKYLKQSKYNLLNCIHFINLILHSSIIDMYLKSTQK